MFSPRRGAFYAVQENGTRTVALVRLSIDIAGVVDVTRLRARCQETFFKGGDEAVLPA